MSGKNIDKILNNAYGKVGNVMGFPFKLYRSVDYLNPLQEKNYLKTVKLAYSIDDSFKQQEEFAFKVYSLWIKSDDLKLGDIFVSEELDKTFTLVSNDPITVSYGFDSRSQITISRPIYTDDGGFGPKQQVIAENIPCKILEKSSVPSNGNMTKNSPYKSGIQQWDIWFYLDTEVKINDTIVDSTGNTSTIESAQMTPLGWKIKAISTKS